MDATRIPGFVGDRELAGAGAAFDNTSLAALDQHTQLKTVCVETGGVACGYR